MRGAPPTRQPPRLQAVNSSRYNCPAKINARLQITGSFMIFISPSAHAYLITIFIITKFSSHKSHVKEMFIEKSNTIMIFMH